MIRFKSFGSGSSGNCYYLGTETEGILIDAGIPVRMVVSELKSEGIDISSGHIRGVLLTHEHADHTRGVSTLANHYGIPIYASVPVHKRMDSCRYIRDKVGAARRDLELGQHLDLAGFHIVSFSVPHDSVQNYGYHITRGEDFSFTLATDIGYVTPEIERYVALAQHLVIEANYDPNMLRAGSYEAWLQERVVGPGGHLSNGETAELLCRTYSPTMRNIWLCHLSKENNHPDLCWRTIEHRLFMEGIRVGKDVTLTTLKRNSASPMYLLQE